MPPIQPSSPEEIRSVIAAAHAARFGSRSDEALSGLMQGTAEAIAQVMSQSLGAYEAEPDFITGSSEKEPTA